jgi:hypothetical protein
MVSTMQKKDGDELNFERSETFVLESEGGKKVGLGII